MLGDKNRVSVGGNDSPSNLRAAAGRDRGTKDKANCLKVLWVLEWMDFMPSGAFSRVWEQLEKEQMEVSSLVSYAALLEPL